MTCTLCAIMKNEARYLLEWVAYHRLIGFDRIVVYENDSDDCTPDLLAALAEGGVIDAAFSWRDMPISPQLAAYYHAARACETDWLMFLDADEFLNLKSRETVAAFLARFQPEVSCIAVNWRVFGSSQRRTYEPGLTIERFTLASRPAEKVNLHVKSFFRPARMESVHMHAPVMKAGVYVMASGAPLEMETLGIAGAIDLSVAQVNHYFNRSYEEYAEKRRRGVARLKNDDPGKYAKYTDDMFRLHDLNDERDDSLLWAAAPVADEMARLTRALRLDEIFARFSGGIRSDRPPEAAS